MRKDGYPSARELNRIKNWSFKRSSPVDLIEYIRERWAYASSGYFKLRGKNTLHLELHTGGWSGNEDIIDALEKNIIFWHMGWQKIERGGHYYFKINLKLFTYAGKHLGIDEPKKKK